MYGEEVFKELFLQVLRQCIEKGMVAGGKQVIDSVLVKADASMDSLKEKEIIADAAQYVKEVKEEDDQNNDSDAPDAGGNTVTAHLS